MDTMEALLKKRLAMTELRDFGLGLALAARQDLVDGFCVKSDDIIITMDRIEKEPGFSTMWFEVQSVVVDNGYFEIKRKVEELLIPNETMVKKMDIVCCAIMLFECEFPGICRFVATSIVRGRVS